MTATVDAPEVADDVVREWARATGRKVGDRGRISPTLRTEYLDTLEQMHRGPDAPPVNVTAAAPTSPPGAAAATPPRGPERPPERPRAAAQERRPQRVAPPRGGTLARARAWFNGAAPDGSGKTTPKPAPARARTSLTGLITRGWTRLATAYEHINVPVARTMAWQAPYVGVVTDDVLAGTPADKFLQPIARAETALTGIGAMIAMPFLVGAITSERNDPETHGLAAAARQQMLHMALTECIDSQLEMFKERPDLAAKITRTAEEQSKRGREIDAIMGMIFAAIPLPVTVPDNATPEQMQAAQMQAERNEQAEQAIRAAAAAVKFMPVPAGPDMRGQAAEAAAASMAASAAAAAASSAATVGAALGQRPQ